MSALHKPAICTMSLGRCFAGHSLAHKLTMAAKYGFQGVEIFYEDLVDFARTMPGAGGGDSPAHQITAAGAIRTICEQLGLEIICLQPLQHYGGLIDREEKAHRMADVDLWMKLAKTLGTNLVLLPSSFLAPEKVSDDLDLLVQDLTELAEIGLQQEPVVRFTHEALCWGTRVDLWEVSWEIVKRVDRPNFGICFDTFNILGRIYADPASPTGRTPDCEQVVKASLQTMLSSVDMSKVFLVQLADAERLSTPLDTSHPFYQADQPTRMSWSRNCRLFYGESQHGAYLPVKPLLATLLHGLGYQGWMSFEVFNRALADPGKDVPEELARRAAKSWLKMVRDLNLEPDGQTNGHVKDVSRVLSKASLLDSSHRRVELSM